MLEPDFRFSSLELPRLWKRSMIETRFFTAPVPATRVVAHRCRFVTWLDTCPIGAPASLPSSGSKCSRAICGYF